MHVQEAAPLVTMLLQAAVEAVRRAVRQLVPQGAAQISAHLAVPAVALQNQAAARAVKVQLVLQVARPLWAALQAVKLQVAKVVALAARHRAAGQVAQAAMLVVLLALTHLPLCNTKCVTSSRFLCLIAELSSKIHGR